MVGIRNGNRREQRLGVGVLGVVEEPRRVAHFDDAAEVHHGRAPADVLDEPQIVRDEEIREPQFLLQLDQQIHHLRLNRHVERRDRLVRDDERRVQRERARDADALALAAAELVRIAIDRRGIEPDEAVELGHARHAGLGVPHLVDDERLFDDLPHAHPAG